MFFKAAPTQPTTTHSQLELKIRAQIKRQHFNLSVNLTLPMSGVLAIYGHSGSGKTSLLRCIAGLEKHSGCEIEFNQQIWQDQDHFIATQKRRIGYVFQEASLFEHLTVKANLDYAIKRAAPQKHIDYQQLIQLLRIEKLLTQMPATLSGGEKQRVAIARALLTQPQLLLMDEPLASLDVNHKYEILSYLEKLKTELNIPIIYISHSPEEVARLADYFVLLDQGEVKAAQPIEESFDLLNGLATERDNAAVYLSAQVVEKAMNWQQIKVRLNKQSEQTGLHLWLTDKGYPLAQELRLKIQAKDVSLSLSYAQDSSIQNIIPVQIEQIQPNYNGMQLITLNAGNQLLMAKISTKAVSDLKLYAGMEVFAQIKAAALI